MGVSQGTLEWTLLAVVATVPIFVGIALLLAMPKSLRDLSRRNAYRHDGSYSLQRAHVEWLSQAQLVGGLIGLQLLVLLPLVFAVCLFHQSIMPLDEGWAALTHMVGDPENSREYIGELRDAQIRRTEILGQSAEMVRAKQSFVWNGWPILGLTGLATAFGSFLLMRRINARLIHEYRRKLLERHRDYLILELAHGTEMDGPERAMDVEPLQRA